jgi:NADH pyrophosphatase NudC (nudix superfamily)
MFSLLTGFIDEGESPEVAVVREMREELGLQAERIDFIGHFPLREFNQLIIAYALQARGTLTLNHEIAEVKVVSRSELAEFDFGPLKLTRDIVSRWLERSGT